MAKKKVEPKEEESDFDDEDLFDDEEVESHYPDLKDDSQSKKKPLSEDFLEEDEEYEFEEDYELEAGPVLPDYKHLKLDMKKGTSEHDYVLTIQGQSHGFCNIFVQHLLNTEGVNSAAYKITGIAPPEIFIRLEDGFNVKEILIKAIEALRTEVLDVQKLFKKLI
ncbi:MAG: RpoL/Rpb11 RNA polymerase subunit family protein [Candidatus Hermodarchaeota archaeon]